MVRSLLAQTGPRAPRRRPAAGSSITRALRVVEAVAVAGDGVTAKAIARRLGCPLPTVYRALGTLVEEGYLVRLHDVHGYGLGYRVAELHRSLTEQVRPEPALRTTLRRGAHGRPGRRRTSRCSATSTSSSRTSTTAPTTPARTALRVGEPTPAHATAAGKVMLAAPAARRGCSELLDRTGLPRLAPRTVADRRALDRELMRIRSDGAAVEVEEYQCRASPGWPRRSPAPTARSPRRSGSRVARRVRRPPLGAGAGGAVGIAAARAVRGRRTGRAH